MSIFAPIQVGQAVQMVSVVSGAVATGTTLIPADDTIPQNTEGDQYLTLAITPKSTTNLLVIEANIFGSHSVTTDIIAALFQDSTAGALAANATFQPTATGKVSLPLRHVMTAGTVSATTFKIRCGGGNAGTFTFNGQATARVFGGITLSSIVITEYKA